MPYTDLREWIRTLEKAGELRRIREPISPYLEMSEIADRTAKLGQGTSNAAAPRSCLKTSPDIPARAS